MVPNSVNVLKNGHGDVDPDATTWCASVRQRKKSGFDGTARPGSEYQTTIRGGRGRVLEEGCQEEQGSNTVDL